MPSAYNPVFGPPVEGAGSIYNPSFVPANGQFGGYNVANYGGGTGYNSLTAYYGYGYNSYISGVAGTSPFFANFLASTGYSGGDTSSSSDISGTNITGSFDLQSSALAGDPEFARLSDPLIFNPDLSMPTSSFVHDSADVYLGVLARGFPDASARAIAGASQHEGGGNPTQVEFLDSWTSNPAHRPGYGQFQFTDTPNLPLLSLFELYIEDRNYYSMGDTGAQIDFAIAMMYPSLYKYLMNPSVSQEQAAQAWAMGFEMGQPNFSGTIWSPALPDYKAGKSWKPPTSAMFGGPMDGLWDWSP